MTWLHHDHDTLITLITLLLCHTQIVGRKRWRFISPLETPRRYHHVELHSPIDHDRPDLERYPVFRDVTVHEAVVEPRI